MPHRKPKLEYALICDDIRHELHGKVTIVGLYGEEILVPAFPFIFPKLSFVIAWKHVKGGESFSIEFKDPGNKTVLDPIRGTTPKNVFGKSTMKMFGSFNGLQVKQAGAYTLSVTFEQDETRHDFQFDIRQRQKESST